MLHAEDIVSMAKDAERYRFMREHCTDYSCAAATPEQFEALVDAFMAQVARKEQE